MTEQDAVADLTRLWSLLPLIVGPGWADLEPALSEALAGFAAAPDDDERYRRARTVLRLCLRHEPLRRALEPAIRLQEHRTTGPPTTPWTDTAAEAATALEQFSRPAGDRWFAADVLDHPRHEPVRPGQPYLVAIGVAPGRTDATAAAEISPDALPGRSASGAVVLTVEVHGNADVEAVAADLTLPSTGPSTDRALFRVTPLAGRDRLTLLALIRRKDTGTFVQHLTLSLALAPADVTSPAPAPSPLLRALGRPVDEALDPGEPEVTLVLEGDVLRLVPDRLKTLPLPLTADWPFTDDDLLAIADGPRSVLREISLGLLDETSGPRAIHQRELTIPEADYDVSLHELLRAGVVMFNKLFFSHGHDDLMAVGDALSALRRDGGHVRINVRSRNNIVPWHLLAFPDPDGTTPHDPDRILGLRHCVSYVPTPRSPAPPTNLRTTGAPLRVVLSLNADLDIWNGEPREVVESQRKAWQSRADGARDDLSVTFPPDDDIEGILLRGEPAGEVLYFFCHSELAPEGGRLGRATASLLLASGLRIRLEDLIFHWPLRFRFRTAPLIVLNACSTAVPPPTVFAGYVDTLLGRGARGLIGTEAEVPAVLAAAWAAAFFTKVLAGVAVADAARRVNRDLVEQHRNLLGLAYALHCDGRHRVSPIVPDVAQWDAS